MDKQSTNDPQTARFLRKQHNREGLDEQEQVQQASFKQNPNSALNKFAMKSTEKNLERQVEYFGNAIEPFHMRNEEEMGEVDEDGFFVFKRKNRVRDAWLDSVGEAEDEAVADQLAKRIKTESRFQSVYEAGEQLNRHLREDQEEIEEEQEEQGEQGGNQKAEDPEQEQKKQGFTFTKAQLIEIMLSLIPDRMNANNYMKKLKADKKMQQYNKLLAISNEYIEMTGEYDILTKKKQALEGMLEQEQQQASLAQPQQQKVIENWDEENESAGQEGVQNNEIGKAVGKQPLGSDSEPSKSNENDDENDNIF